MTPIRAIFNYKEEVKYDPENPAHAKYAGMAVAMEERTIGGFITEILTLNDSFKDRVLDGVVNNVSQYKEIPMTKTGVYVVFWMDMETHYQMSVQDFNSMTVSSKEMRNYVSKFQTA